MVSNMMGEPVTTLTYAMATNREGETLLESMVRPLKWVKRAERNVHRHDVAAKVKNPAPDPPQTMRQNLDQDRGYNRLAFSPALILAVPTAFPSSITQCACLCVCTYRDSISTHSYRVTVAFGFPYTDQVFLSG